MNTEQVRNIVKDILSKHTYLKEENGHFKGEIYVESDEELSEASLKTISQAENKKEAFDAIIDGFYQHARDYEEDEMMRLVRKHWDEENYGDYEEASDEVLEIIQELVSWTFPEDLFLYQTACVNLLVDTGDGDTDFTCNNLSNYYARNLEDVPDEEFIQKESSILWLAKQQGYSEKQLLDAVRRDIYHDSPLLKSIDIESSNTTTWMNALSFFVKMTLEDFMKLCDEKRSVTLSKGTPCGLYDCWNGAGGVLEIVLEKDVEIPSAYIQAHIEGTRGYGIDQVYGMMSSFWKDTVKEMKQEEKTS